MKRILTGFLVFITLNAFCQKDKYPAGSYYLYNTQWKSVTKPEEAAYFAHRLQESDTAWKWDVYNYAGPLIASLHFKDKDLSQLHGTQYYYHATGYLDSSGDVTNGKQHGDWGFFNDSGVLYLKKVYDNGILVSSEGPKENTADTSTSKDEHESMFTGGTGQWKKYISKNLQYPERAQNLKIEGLVITDFIVDAAGNVSHVTIFKSTEFSIDEETIRLIKNSPKWQPAWQRGRHVKSYKRQPLVYKLQ